jgi:hypothetical protein
MSFKIISKKFKFKTTVKLIQTEQNSIFYITLIGIAEQPGAPSLFPLEAHSRSISNHFISFFPLHPTHTHSREQPTAAAERN